MKRMISMKICVLGAGTWGCALASLLAKNNNDVVLWSAIPSEIEALQKTETHKNLPGAIMPVGIKYTEKIEIAMKDAELCLFVVPSQFIRSTAALIAPFVEDGQILVNASKGIESGSLMTMTEVISDELARRGCTAEYYIAALSGPTHAEEVAIGLPTSIVAACEWESVSLKIADVFKNSCLRVYTNSDVLGVELCGALKNIIAIAAGICRGIEFGDNATAMLITRGMREITRLGIAMGCNRETFNGLAGIGDLIVTSTSHHSRNNRCGELIGKGLSYAEASERIGMVVEGYHALKAALELSDKYGVEMPITRGVDSVINKNESPFSVIRRLMLRDVKDELTV